MYQPRLMGPTATLLWRIRPRRSAKVGRINTDRYNMLCDAYGFGQGLWRHENPLGNRCEAENDGGWSGVGFSLDSCPGSSSSSILFYSIVSFSFLRRIYKNQGNVFARVVYMPRWSCILSLYDSTVLSVYTSGIQQIGKRPNNKTNQVSLHQ